MYTLPTNLEIENNEFNNVIQVVYSKAKKYLEKPLHMHYTDHTIGHSERILGCINQLINNMAKPLNDEEKFIIVCAVLLHDIGMQAPKQYLSDISSEYPLSKEALEKLRDVHHTLSKQIIKDSVTKSDGLKFGFELFESTKRMVNCIAIVAEHHRRLDIKEIQDDNIGGIDIRLKFLCSLIRLCDCLDVDFNRVDMERLKLYDIAPKSKFFWYCHHYISTCKIENLKIQLKFEFSENDEQKNDFITTMVNHVKQEIEEHIKQVFDSLDDWGVRMVSEVRYDIKYISTAEEMPPDLLDYIQVLLLELEKKGHTNSDAFGEIDFYWGGDRDTANSNIETYLTTTNSSNIFIAAIGFGTINSVLEKDTVIEHFYELISNPGITSHPDKQFKITFILPGTNDDLRKFRPELTDKEVNDSHKRGHTLLSLFREKLSKKCFPEIESEEERLRMIAPYIGLKKYNKENSIPRHFILYGSDNNIFVGSYLCWTTGRKSYIMKLKPCNEPQNKNDRFMIGLFDLFTNEIDWIDKHSIDTELKVPQNDAL
jgi:hypothetical protein